MAESLLNDPPQPISAVERDTGLSKDTLRMWERRYGFPEPLRDAIGERLYPPDQVEKLRLIKRLMDQGMRPGQLIGNSIKDLAGIIAAQAARAGGRCVCSEFDMLLALIQQHRCEELRATLSQLLMKSGLQQFVTDVVAPCNRLVGEAWMRGEIEVHEEHLYTEQVQNVVRAAISAHLMGSSPPRVLLTTLPEEEHGLGLLMVEAMLAAEGAQCVSLGTRTPLADIPAAAVAHRADIVALSFSGSYPARIATVSLRSLRAALPAEIEIWAGGSALFGRQRELPEIRVITDIADSLAVLQQWRNARHGKLT
jgi:MerR family transcriptional regulator, light-induced transcriptional regulator